jgi:hypothetical protein
MGYNGIGVSFTATPYAVAADATADALGALVDDVIEADFMVGLAMARRAERIERARAFADSAARAESNSASLGSGSSGSLHSRLELAERAFASELGAALRIPDLTARNLIATSRTLVNDLPATLTALAEGRLTYRHAQILVDQCSLLDPQATAKLEAAVLPAAERMTPSQFERKARTTRERLEPDTMVERQVAAEADRNLCVVPQRDGMGSLIAELPIGQVIAIDNRVTEIARSLQGSDETRTLTQLKADVFSDILLDVAGCTPGEQPAAPDSTTVGHSTTAGRGDGPAARYRSIRPRVLVTVPAMTLLHRSTQPGTLEGYGPIDPQTARELTANAASLTRLLTHPETGIVLSMGRKKYRIPDNVRTWLRVRDGTCRFPGCSRNALRCDLDHTDDWANGGETSHTNLAHLCRGHHTLKHATGWTVTQSPDGSGNLTWTSPAGTTYPTTPETTVLS